MIVVKMLELRGIEQKAELPGTDIDGPLFRVQTRTPAPSKKPLWARFEERRQHEEATSKDINMNTPNTSHVTESEDFLTLRHHPDASDSGIEDHFGDFSASEDLTWSSYPASHADGRCSSQLPPTGKTQACL